jgi:molybdenum cofactor cytidylyltransferase
VIAAVLLAAGSSRRFGASGSKLLADLNGSPVIRWSAAALREPRVSELSVVTDGSDALRVALEGTGARIVRNPEAARGMGCSIACGVAALSPEVRAVLIALGDEPFLDPDVVRVVLDRYDARGAAIVAPRFAGVQGHPVLFERSTFAELAALDGDQGARAVIERDGERVDYVDLPGPAASDVDTPDDLALARARAQNKAPFTSH